MPSADGTADEVGGTSQGPVASRPTFGELHVQYLAAIKRVEQGVKDVKSLARRLQQATEREVKQLHGSLARAGRRKRPARDPDAPKRTPKGIAGPGPLSAQLAAFLEVDPSTEMARTEVIRRLATYIKKNNLQNPQNKRLIVPDQALEGLLKFPKDFEGPISYFNLQQLLKHHYPKDSHQAPAPTGPA